MHLYVLFELMPFKCILLKFALSFLYLIAVFSIFLSVQKRIHIFPKILFTALYFSMRIFFVGIMWSLFTDQKILFFVKLFHHMKHKDTQHNTKNTLTNFILQTFRAKREHWKDNKKEIKKINHKGISKTTSQSAICRSRILEYLFSIFEMEWDVSIFHYVYTNWKTHK